MSHSRAETMRVEQRRAKVAALALRGLRPSEIATALGNDDAAGRVKVSQDLKAIRAEWAASAVRDFDAAKGKLLEELAMLRRELWVAWERSKQGRAGKQRDPDPRYAAALLHTMEVEADLLGFHARPGERPTSVPVVSFQIHGPDVIDLPVLSLSAPCPTGNGGSPAPPVQCGLKELPPGASADDYEWVEVDDGEETGAAQEGGDTTG
jgi:hypothetical protein